MKVGVANSHTSDIDKLGQVHFMLHVFSTILNGVIKGLITKEDVQQKIRHLLEGKLGQSVSPIMDTLQDAFAEGKLTPDQYRFMVETVTTINMDITLKNRQRLENDTILLNKENQVRESNNMSTFQRERNNNSAKAQNKNHYEQTLFQDRPEIQNKENITKHTEIIQIGTTLKDRFVLTKRIGSGGMGIVYEARDLVKVQAQDKNPLVAIKVLSEKFKKHTSSFIALQREASKSQKLAHPNIATVYDFDHNRDTVYMTMELLTGQAFDKVIERMPPDGLPLELAMDYIRQLCLGLAYAHQQKLIHSDLKPGNIFLCNNGTVKLLDFGITRAIKSENEDETIFDPSSLRALTPAYATAEMFLGKNADPRDDIYALACVAYELLGGSHPYKKVAANKALELGLKPPRIKKLSRRQQKHLNKALNLTRDSRTATVEEFMTGVLPAKSHTKQLIIGSLLLFSIIAGILIKPVNDYFKEESRLNFIQSIKAGDTYQLSQLLANIHTLDTNQKINLSSVLRKEIINHYQTRINNAINAGEKKYNFPEAYQLLSEVKDLYPDSASLQEAEKQLSDNKIRLVNELIRRYNEINTQGGDTTRILAILREAEPQHPILVQ